MYIIKVSKKEGGVRMEMGLFRKMRLLNVVVCLAFCLNLVLPVNVLASIRPSDAAMLRPQAAASKIEDTVLALGINMLKELSAEGLGGLKARLADLVLDKIEDPVERAFIEEGLAVFTLGSKTYVVSLIGNGFKIDLSRDELLIEPFASESDRDAFISGGQLTWLAGDYTPAQVIAAQAGTKTYLQEAGQDGRIFTEDELAKSVASYSARRTLANRQLPPLDEKKEQPALVKRLKTGFVFLDKTINSITEQDVDAMMPIGLPSSSIVKIGAQDFSLRGGAAVGTVTIGHLKEIGIQDSVVGHSATRFTEMWKIDAAGLFIPQAPQEGDTSIDVRSKLEQASKNKVKVTYCVGETLKVREEDKNAVGFVLSQLDNELGILNLSGEQVLELLEAVAYEPLWAIGTGVTPQLEDIQEMHAAIRKWFADKYNENVASKIVIQYGGSVKPDNATGIFALADVDGALIGGASLGADSFVKIAQIADIAGRKKHITMHVSANWKAEEAQKRDTITEHLKALALVRFKLENTAINYYLPFTLLAGAQDILANAISPKVSQVKQDLANNVRQAIVLDEDDNPSFFYKGEAGTPLYLAVTASSGGYMYSGYDYDRTGGKLPRSIYHILAMIESYMEMTKTDPWALAAFKAKLLHEYFEVSGDSRFHREESQAVKDLINNYDKLALVMWKAREAKKAQVRLERENKKVVREVHVANIGKFLDPRLDEVMPDDLIDAVRKKLQGLVESGLLTDYEVFPNTTDVVIYTTRQNKNANEDDAKIPLTIVDVFLTALNTAKEMGIYKGEDLSDKSYLEQTRAIELRGFYKPVKDVERTADPYALISASNTYAGAFNLLSYQIACDPMYNAGATIDPSMPPFIFKVLDLVKDEIQTFDGQTEMKKILALINQPGKYVTVAIYARPGWSKVPADEPLMAVTVRRIADDGVSEVGDFNPVMMIRSQSGLPAWGEILAPIGTAMPIVTYGGDKTRHVVAWRPTNKAEAGKIPASRRQGLSLVTGFGFQSHNNGRIGRAEDLGGHQSFNPTRENAERWARLFFKGVLSAPAPVEPVSSFATLDEVDVDGKTVYFRPDVNVQAQNGHILNPDKPSARVLAHAQTLKELLDKNGKVIMVFHQGRPGDADFMATADEHARQMSKLVGRELKVVDDLFGDEAIAAIKALKPGEGLVLKPVRAEDPSNPGKTLESNPLFVERLRPLIDLLVLDGFSVAHRDSPSVTGFKGIPAVAGRVMEREIKGASNLLNPLQPQLLVVGGGKVTEKLLEMASGLETGRVQKAVVGGRLGNLCLIAAQPGAATATTPEAQYGLAVATVGKATADDLKEFLTNETFPPLVQLIVKHRDRIELPTDAVYLEGETRHEVKLVDGRVPDGFNQLLSGIGPKTAQRYAEIAGRAEQPFASAFVIGPLSDSRYPALLEETSTVLEPVSRLEFWSTGGGDTEVTVRQLGFTPTYTSLAGGALAEYKAGKELPGVKLLVDNHPALIKSAAVEYYPDMYKVKTGEYAGKPLVRRHKYTRMIDMQERIYRKAMPIILTGVPKYTLKGKEAKDSRGKPTVAAILGIEELEDLAETGLNPAGASTGEREANTVGVAQAIKNINDVIAPMLINSDLDLRRHADLIKMEEMLINAAGENFRVLGADATVPVSWALWQMAARLQGMELDEYISKYEPDAVSDSKDPVLFYQNIYNGGLHALGAGETLGKDRIDIQEIMIVPIAKTYRQALRIGDAVDLALKTMLTEKFSSLRVSRRDEAGFSVKGLGNSSEAIGYVVEAIKKAGYVPGKDVKLALDTAASTFYEDGLYQFQGKNLTSDEMIAYYLELAKEYKGILLSIEDGLAENDWAGWARLTKAMRPLGIDIIGDDLFVTQLAGLERGIAEGSATSILIKVNQNGTVLGTLQVIKRAKAAGYRWVVSHRSGETLHTGIADLVYATRGYGLKTGDPQPMYDFGKLPASLRADRPVDATVLPSYMDHVTKLEPFLSPHSYSRNDLVVKTRERLDYKFMRNPVLKEGEADPLLQHYGDHTLSNIKADIGSVPGHYKPHPVTMRALNEILQLAKTYGFNGVNQYILLAETLMILRTGLTIEEVVGKNGVYRKADADTLMKKVAEFKEKEKISNWDEAISYLEKKGVDDTIVEMAKNLKLASQSEAYFGFPNFMQQLEEISKRDAEVYHSLTESRRPTAKEIDAISTMSGLTAGSATSLFTSGVFKSFRELTNIASDLADNQRILDYRVWNSGDDCQLTLKHKLLPENNEYIHPLAWNSLWYAADQTSYFKPYGWKQDILVDKLVSGNIQGAGAGYAEVVVRNGEIVMAFSGDKCAPGAFTVPILGMLRKAIKEGKFKNGVIAEIWDINNKPRAFFDLADQKQYDDALTLLGSPEDFAIKRVWVAKKKWDGKEDIANVIEDIPLIAASTERLALTAGKYVGKDDPTLLVRVSLESNERLEPDDIAGIFQYPQITLGFMRGSHVGPLVPGTQIAFFMGKDQELVPEGTPHFFDGPPPVVGLVMPMDQSLRDAEDVFANRSWFKGAIDQGNFITQVARRQGAFPFHKVEGPDTEYTSVPEVMAALEAEGRGRPAGHEPESQFMKALLSQQSPGVSHRLSSGVIDLAKDAANRKVVLISSSALRDDASLLLALESINKQINQNLGVFESNANIKANAFQFILVSDGSLRTEKDVERFFGEIAKVTRGGVTAAKDILSRILTQADMDEGRISDPAALVKQLQRNGIPKESVAALIGPLTWTDSLKAQGGIAKATVTVNLEAKANQIAPAAGALYGALEAVAAPQNRLSDGVAKKLDLLIRETAITVQPRDINKKVEDAVRAYQEVAHRV
ncbi:MAG: fructose 1,6-bisphosphatase [Candidatus Omnitrophota bacterium]